MPNREATPECLGTPVEPAFNVIAEISVTWPKDTRPFPFSQIVSRSVLDRFWIVSRSYLFSIYRI